ncbi:MAG: hypothetical protein ABEJ66_01230, partial [Candidatus Nanohaloarchaea archaeon]
AELEQLEGEYEKMVEEPYIDEDNRWVVAAEEEGEPVGILHDTIRWGPELAGRKRDRLQDLETRNHKLLED